MDATFWHQRWEQRIIGFNEKAVNPLLIAHFPKLDLAAGSRVFVPLCGKTIAIGWLLAQGYQVVGVELSEMAIHELFAELDVAPTIETDGALTRFSAENLDIFVGDFFALSAETLGTVNAIYDRAALVALPADLRDRYTTHLTTITKTAPQLLLTFEYDQQVMDGPPFSISAQEVNRHYAAIYQVQMVANVTMDAPLKGVATANEVAWLLTTR